MLDSIFGLDYILGAFNKLVARLERHITRLQDKHNKMTVEIETLKAKRQDVGYEIGRSVQVKTRFQQLVGE